jgi:hypothetical protein
MITTTQCEHCGGAIEFELDSWQEGAFGDCPHCKQETRLRRVEIYEAPKGVAKNRKQMLQELDRKPPAWRPVGAGPEILFFLIGTLLVCGGVALMLLSDNAINEVACVIISATGVLCWGINAILGHLRNISEKK